MTLADFRPYLLIAVFGVLVTLAGFAISEALEKPGRITPHVQACASVAATTGTVPPSCYPARE